MASTSIAAGPPETKSTNTSHETAPSPSTSVMSTILSMCSSFFVWLSSFIPWRSLQSDSRASTPTADHEAAFAIPDNEAPASFAVGRLEMEPDSSTGSKAAFDGIAPSASTSASKRTQKPCYDVFINHRGPDVKDTLASVLFAMLTGMSLSVFLDSQELKYGDFLPRTIEAAMATALLHIAIFSKRYAESPWCLAELSFMLKSGAKIIPIFYQVDPNDLRWVHKGKYAKAFRKHEQKGRYTPELLQEWKSALHVVSFCSGQIVKTKEDEMRLLKTIVSCVLKEINSNGPLVVAKHPVGLEEIVEDFKANTLQSVQGNQNAQIVGIWGMGGSGKTTLAKKLYNEISSSIERSSFVFDVRDAATKGLLYEKQKKLLNDLRIQGSPFDNIEEGMRNISRALRSARVLIVLDDVDNMQQLDALLPTKDNLAKGSLIIVTTRACDVLKSWGISSIYKMKGLNPLYAEQLFCWHAFLKSCPPDGFKKLVKQFLKVCNGLPLSIKIFGAQLYGESREEHWESQLDKISKTLSDDIKEILKISYDTLDGEEKEMFLDTACFFIGQKSSSAIEAWNGIRCGALQSWERLLNRCLVELDNENCINMHDHLRDLGRDIANKQSPYRLWYPQQIIDIQKQVEKRSGIHGIITTSNQVIHCFKDLAEMIRKDKEVEEFRFSCSHGKLMVSTNGGIRSLKPSLFGLKYLVISGDFLNQEMGDISRELVWLRWFQIGRRDLPSGLPLKKLRVLELYENVRDNVHHLEELWGKSDDDAPVQLRQLLISNCHKFQGFPKSIGHLIHLKKIVIIYGHNVTSLPDEFCLLQSLEHLVLYDCRRLSSLPYNFGNLRNLRHLNLSGCAKLRRLPVTFKNLRLLEHLNLRSCEDLTFASEDLNFLENIARLEFLNLHGCKKLEELPRHITNQVSLRELDFSDTRIRELPDNIGQLTRLTEMRMYRVLLTSLPKSLGDLSSLTNLEISAGPKLECLPDSLGDLSSLTNLDISAGHNLKCLPDSLGDLSSLTNLKISSCYKLECLPDSLGDLSSLTNLEISYCSKLECLPDSLGDLSSLTNLKIRYCPKLKCLPVSIRQLSNLQELSIYECPISECDYGAASLPFGWSNLKKIYLRKTEVCRISFSEACCPHLESLDVEWNHQLKEIEALPMTLKSIHLNNCEMLKNIPNFAGFTSLKEFHLEGCYGIEKIEGLENCTRLEKLIVETCWEVPGIESLEHMQDLKRLILKANNISVIEHCIQRIQKWPDERIIICARAVPDAVSLLHSSLSPNLVILHSISNMALDRLFDIGLVLKGDAIMFCFVINCVSSQMTLHTALDFGSLSFNGHVRKGRWLLVGVVTQHINGGLYIRTSDPYVGVVEKGLVVRGEEQTVREAVRRLLPLFSL